VHPNKIARSGIGQAVDGRPHLYSQRGQLDDIDAAISDRYVVDDKLRI
jgi:hypothetical protein